MSNEKPLQDDIGKILSTHSKNCSALLDLCPTDEMRAEMHEMLEDSEKTTFAKFLMFLARHRMQFVGGQVNEGTGMSDEALKKIMRDKTSPPIISPPTDWPPKPAPLPFFDPFHNLPDSRTYTSDKTEMTTGKGASK